MKPPSEAAIRDLQHHFAEQVATVPVTSIAVAVSGGGDSMACLHLACRYALENSVRLEAVSVNHGLRSEAASEIELVRKFCDSQGIHHEAIDWKWDQRGNLQASARDARYRLISTWAKTRDIEVVMLGHTKNDVAETFLMRLARRSGVEGLARMEETFNRHGVKWMRPLLDIPRVELRALLRQNQIDWVDDPSNEDTRFDRVKIRRALEDLAILGLDIDTIAAVSKNLRGSEQTIRCMMNSVAEMQIHEDRGDLLLAWGVGEKDGGPTPEIQLRLLRAAISWVSGADFGPRSDAIEALREQLNKGKQHTLGGCILKVERSVGAAKLRIAREYNAVRGIHCRLEETWDGRWKLDGPSMQDVVVGALGEGLNQCINWRETGLPRQSLMASPAIWAGSELISAPVAGHKNGWEASATGRGAFTQFLLSR